MGIYSEGYENTDVEVDYEELMEAFFYDDMSSLSDDEKRVLFESSDYIMLEKNNITNRKTTVRLNKNDDITRRTTMAALQISKEKGDSLWKQLVANRIKERKLLSAILKKYGNTAKRVAMVGQKQYMRNVNKPKLLKTSDISHRD